MTSDVSARRSITIVDYDPAWLTQFETLRSTILSAVGDIAVAVEHVGSTSVPGLAAKPIIDIDLVVASAADVSVAIERLAVIGYEHRGNLVSRVAKPSEVHRNRLNGIYTSADKAGPPSKII